MDTPLYTILIADRNPNIRSFLKRELASTDWHIHLAGTGNDLVQTIYGPIQVDLIIMDPDFSDIPIRTLIKKIQGRVPFLPVIVHSLNMDMLSALMEQWAPSLVEKNGSSVEILKTLIPNFLTPYLPLKRDPPKTEASHENPTDQKSEHPKSMPLDTLDP